MRVLIGESFVGEGALQAGTAGTPNVPGILAARHAPGNPFFTP
jgi:hypothetical protein